MVADSDSKLAHLFALQQQLKAAQTSELAFAQVAATLKAALQATQIEWQSAKQADPAGRLQLPISNSGFFVTIERATPFTEDEIAFGELTIALLDTAPGFAKWSTETNRLFHLIEKINQNIAKNNDEQTIFDLLNSEFGLVFPGALGQLLLQDERDKWQVRAVFGNGVNPAGTLAVADDSIVRLARTGKTVYMTGNEQVVIPISGRSGVLLIKFARKLIFPSQTISGLELLAQSIGLGLQNHRLSQESWQHSKQLQTIYTIAESVRSLKPLHPTLAEIHAQISRVVNAPSFYFALYDAEMELLSFPYAVENGQEVVYEPISASDGNSLVAWVLTTGQPFLTGEWNDDRPVFGIVGPEGAPTSVICLPLRAGDETVGAISIQSHLPHAFNQAIYQFMIAVANHLAVIIKNHRFLNTTQDLLDTITKEYMTAATLRKVLAVVGSSLNLDETLDHLLGALGELVTFDSASIGLLEMGQLVFRSHRPYQDSYNRNWVQQATFVLQDNPLLNTIMTQKEPIMLSDVTHDPRWSAIEGFDYIRSWVGVPLLFGQQVLGILTVDRAVVAAYSSRDMWLVATLASHAAIAVQNARLHEEVQQQLRELTTLYNAAATITANLDYQSLLHTVAGEMLEALGADSCTIFVQPPGRNDLRRAAHEARSNITPHADLSSIPNPERHPIIRQVLESGEPYHLLETSHNPHEIHLLGLTGLRALLIVPLIHRNQVLGLLTIGLNQERRVLSEHEVRMVRNLSGHVAVAIEHANLYRQAQRRNEELSTFHRISLQLNSQLELEVLLESITSAALRLIQASNLHLYLYDPQQKSFPFCSALWRDGRRTPAVPTPRPGGLTMSVINNGEAIVIDQAPHHTLYQSAEAARWGVQAIAGFPLKYGGQVIGAFTVTFLEHHTFTPDELLLLNLLADQAAVAVANANLFSEVQNRLNSMSALVDMAKQVTGNLNVDKVLNTTVQILKELLKARASTITLISKDGTELVVEAAAGIRAEFHKVHIKIGEGVSGRVVASGQLIYVPDTHQESNFLFFDRSMRSLMVAPLIIRDQVIGTLTVDSDRPNAFSNSVAQLITIAASQVSVAIVNARLFETVEERAVELAAAYEELKENDRLKDELVQNVSHELRTPLTFVRGYIDLLLDGAMGDLNEEQSGALKIVSEQTNEITRLVEDIMALQRIDANNLVPELFSMADLVAGAVAYHQIRAQERGISLDVEPSPTQGMIYADRGRLNQVLNNLIGNALKFSRTGGHVQLRLLESWENILVVVADDGIGIPKDKIERIFERFYQVDGTAQRRFGGAGIGLAIVRLIIEAHRGEVWVKSEVNRGSTFYVLLPKNYTA